MLDYISRRTLILRNKKKKNTSNGNQTWRNAVHHILLFKETYPIIQKNDYIFILLLSARTAMWSMPVVLTEWEKENDSQNQCKSMQHYVILQFQRMRCVRHDVILALAMLVADGIISD